MIDEMQRPVFLRPRTISDFLLTTMTSTLSPLQPNLFSYLVLFIYFVAEIILLLFSFCFYLFKTFEYLNILATNFSFILKNISHFIDFLDFLTIYDGILF